MTYTHWIVVAYGLAGFFVFTRMALILRSARVVNGDRLRWPVMAALAWAHILIAFTWAITPHYPGILTRQFVRGSVVAALAPVSWLSLRILWPYWKKPAPPSAKG